MSARGAPCCGGNSLLPSLITGDNRSQVSLSFSQGSVNSDVLLDGEVLPREADDIETTQTMKVAGAYRFSDLAQVGFEVPVVRRFRSVSGVGGTAVGLGDIGVNVAYEFLPEYTYSSWKPRGFAFFRYVAPTGRSIYSSVEDQTDIFGRGFHFLSLGSVWTKTLSSWDALLTFEAHWALSRTFERPEDVPLQVGAGWGASALLGVGWSPANGPVRIGTSLGPVFESSRSVFDTAPSESARQISWTLAFQASLRFFDEWTATVTYSDQNLLGGARNVMLSRAVSVLLLKDFPL